MRTYYPEIVAISDKLSYTVEVRPAGPPPPTMLFLRNQEGFPKVVVTETEAFEMYLALKEYFEGDDGHDPETG